MVKWVYVTATIGLATSIFGVILGWGLFPFMVNKKVGQSIIIVEGSEQYDRFLQTPQAVLFKVYVFNVTNPEEVQEGAVPIVKEVGPYVYKQYRRKSIREFSKNGTTVTYTQQQQFEFDSELSAPRTQSDKLVVLNMPLNIAENDPGLSILMAQVNANLKNVFNNPTSMFLTTTVDSYLFSGVRFCINATGIARMICRQIREKSSRTIRALEDGSLAFSFFHHKNTTHDGIYEVYTGTNNVGKTMQIYKWNEDKAIQVWVNPSPGRKVSVCNMINGSDGSAFPPYQTPGQSMFIFSTDICRSVQLDYHSQIQYHGIPGFRYEISRNFLREIGPEYSNECFCGGSNKLMNIVKKKNGCLYAGALDLSPCLGEYNKDFLST